METPVNDRVALVQDAYQFENWQIAATLLTEVLGLPAITARQQAKKSHGFLAANVPRAIAERLRDACAGQKIGAQLVPQSDVIPATKPLRVHEVCIADDAPLVQAPGSDTKTPLGWDTLRLIAVTKTTKRESFRHWETVEGRGRVTDVQLKVTAYTEDYAEYLADVFAISQHGEVHGVRLISRELNYAEALGDRAPDGLVASDARTEGFRLLVSSIATHAPQAYLPPESLALLKKTARETARTPPARLEEFEAYNRWLLQQLHLKGAPPEGVKLR